MLLSGKQLHHGTFSGIEREDGDRYSSPQAFFPLTRKLAPLLAAAALLSCIVGLHLGLFSGPVDAGQTEVVRIVFIHVPASWAALLICLAMALLAGVGLAFDARLAAMAAQALAPTGLMFAFLGVWTGCLWSKAIGDSWWVWDLRTHLEMVLVLLYLGVIGLHMVIDELHGANKACAWLVLAAVLSVPPGIAAVQAWSGQPQVVLPWIQGAAGLDAHELVSVLALSLGFLLYAGAASLLRLRCVILERERDSEWVAQQRSAAP